MQCRDCRHWEHEWYSEEWDQWCGYGCHKLEGGKQINVGICLLAPRETRVRLENVEACELLKQRESSVDSDVKNILFGADGD